MNVSVMALLLNKTGLTWKTFPVLKSHDFVRASLSYPEQDYCVRAHDRLHEKLSVEHRKVYVCVRVCVKHDE